MPSFASGSDPATGAGSAPRVRPMENDDVPDLVAAGRAAATLFASAGLDLPDGDPRHVLRGAAWVLVVGRPAVGYAAVSTLGAALAPEWSGGDRRAAYLEELAVRPDRGGAGLGTALLRAVCDRARERGLSWVTLTTFRDVRFNAPFYTRRGFAELPSLAWGAELHARWREEERAGIAVAPRIAMCRRLVDASGAGNVSPPPTG
ncbi:ribosomal protein S18 acetylase RimI-like enzyme [Haloactinospora alba]|uniref:Ribosomal protein S18 acetylase RimI-like enzyme n=1 Tax=Haloactinospora alba TaxID=405555 RepID=A0A543NGR1_9ACTN|nr:GNAT family N-acetyltransferase [Haloactinospora alba]TQN31029.1 ribosomal protein S18 acetylase RimI-like enzyme [Haloactinospora alba]